MNGYRLIQALEHPREFHTVLNYTGGAAETYDLRA